MESLLVPGSHPARLPNDLSEIRGQCPRICSSQGRAITGARVNGLLVRQGARVLTTRMAESVRTQEGRAKLAGERAARVSKLRPSQRVPEHIGAGRVKTSAEIPRGTAPNYIFTTASGTTRGLEVAPTAYRHRSREMNGEPLLCMGGCPPQLRPATRKRLIMSLEQEREFVRSARADGDRVGGAISESQDDET